MAKSNLSPFGVGGGGGGGGGGSGLTTGSAFPDSPSMDDVHIFNAAVSNIDAKDFDGASDLTSAFRGDGFKYDGADWVKQFEDIGEGAGSEAAPVKTSRALPVAFYANWTDKADQQANDFTDTEANLMQIEAADVLINQGGFTVETANSLSDVVIPAGEGGLYLITAHAYFDSSSGRATPRPESGLPGGQMSAMAS